VSDNQENASGLTIPDQEEYLPGDAHSDQALSEMMEFTPKMFRLLEEYSKDLNWTRAWQSAGYKNSPSYLKKKQGFVQELELIHEAYRKRIRQTSDHAASKMLSLFEKFEDDYDQLDIDANTKAAMGRNLVSLSDQYLRAVGMYSKEKDGTRANVNVQINIDRDSDDQSVTIEHRED
jgi:hypothetical protein